VRAGVVDANMTVFHDMVDGVAEFVVHGSPVRHGISDLQGQLSCRVFDGEVDVDEQDATFEPSKGGVR
jgi:hypothetical protein